MVRKIFAVATLIAVLFRFVWFRKLACMPAKGLPRSQQQIGVYWRLLVLFIDNGDTYEYGAPFYDSNVLARGTLNHVQIQTQHGLRPAYVNLYKDDGALGKTITFVSCQDTAFHYVADDYFLDFDVYATVLGGKLRNVMGTCGNPEADWKYSVPPDPLRPATGYALLDIPYDLY